MVCVKGIAYFAMRNANQIGRWVVIHDSWAWLHLSPVTLSKKIQVERENLKSQSHTEILGQRGELGIEMDKSFDVPR